MVKCTKTPLLLAASILFFQSAAYVFCAEPYPQEEFVANISASAPEWRPHYAYNADEAQILSAVFEGLFVYDPFDLEPVPAIAESWTVSEDGKKWTFTLRENAKFSSGERITAEHFKNSLIALLNPDLSAPYASLLDPVAGAAAYRNGETSDPALVGITASGPRTLVIELVSRTEHLPKILCHHAFSAVHPRDLASSAQAGEKQEPPISSGAFSVASVDGERILLEKNPQYWDADRVELPSIKLVLSDDPDVLTSRFNRGEIHWLAGSVNVSRVLDSASIHINPMFATEYFFFRTTWGLGSNKGVRQALLKAVPWEELRSSYLIPAKTLVFPIAGYPELDGVSSNDPAEASRLLKEAGILNPETELPLVISIPEADSFKKLAEILKTAWEELGFSVQIRVIPYGTYYNTLRRDDYSLGITSWIGDFADPLSFLEMFRPNSSLNDSGWKNDAYEQLILDASGKKQTKDRYSALAEAEKLLLGEGIILPVAHNPSFNVIDLDGIAGWYTNALDIHPFKFVRFVAAKPLPGVAMAVPGARGL